MRQFGQNDGRLERVESTVHAQQGMVMTFGSAVGADGFHSGSQFIVIGEERSSIPIASERFGWKKAGATDGGDGATFASMLRGTEALCCVF